MVWSLIARRCRIISPPSASVYSISVVDGSAWTSSDPKVLSVTPSPMLNIEGKGTDTAVAYLTGISKGQATVTAATKDGKTASVVITVEPKPTEERGIFYTYTY